MMPRSCAAMAERSSGGGVGDLAALDRGEMDSIALRFGISYNYTDCDVVVLLTMLVSSTRLARSSRHMRVISDCATYLLCTMGLWQLVMSTREYACMLLPLSVL